MKNCKPHEKLSLKVSVSNRFTNEIGSFHDYAIYIIFNVFLCAMDKLIPRQKERGNVPSTLM